MARRVFLGLTEVAGYFAGLEDGFRGLGVEVRFADLSANPLGYRRDAARRPSRRARLLSLGASPAGTWRRRTWDLLLSVNRAVRRLRALGTLPVALARFDTFILAGGGLFADGREIPLLRRLGKDVVVVFLGSDHRPPYLNGIWVRDADTLGYGRIKKDARSIRDRVRRVEDRASAVVALPTSAQFHTRSYVNFLQIGFPFAPPATKRNPPRPRGSRVVALHCPTNIASKGTVEIRTAIDGLRARGVDIDYREISGRPHHEVISAIQDADFVIDEVYSDTPMAGFATEAAYFGRPAVVTGYFADHLDQLAVSSTPPTLNASPSELMPCIEALATNTALREDLGERARMFVTDVWSPKGVAERLLSVLDGDAPSSWWVDPDSVTYAHGWGMDEGLLRAGLRNFIDQCGAQSLAMDHRPATRARLEAMAGGGAA
jgi:glycosyltransferase involved in cell wall biosynthesis